MVKTLLTFAEKFPEAADYWHPSLNGDRKPESFSPWSKELAWWLCKRNPEHAWSASVKNLSMGCRCPYCSGNKVHESNSLATLFPEMSKQWHPSKNGALRPTDVTAHSGAKVWWRCSQGHDWQAKINSRSRNGCPYCAGYFLESKGSLKDLFPEVAAEWHPSKNRYIYSTPETWHGVENRRIPTDKRPQKNRRLRPSDVAPFSGESVWWRCSVNTEHVWQAAVCDRTKKRSRCPYCAKRQITDENNLQATHPTTATMWHHSRNGKLRPTDVTHGSKKEVWWQCRRNADHVFKRSIATVTRSWKQGHTGCPFCHGKAINKSNSIQTNKAMAALWHAERNLPMLPSQLSPGSRTSAWWQCPKFSDHVWETSISSIAHSLKNGNSGCPFCRGLAVTEKESFAALYPSLLPYWDWKKNKSKKPSELGAGSHFAAHWRCTTYSAHQFKRSVRQLVELCRRDSVVCPMCRECKTEKANRNV